MKNLLRLVTVFFHLLWIMPTTEAQVTDTFAKWIWIGGTTSTPAASYGTLGVAENATTRHPGTRVDAVSWSDNSGYLWLFGGFYNLSNTFQDVWKYDPANHTWTWVHGSSGYGGAAKVVSAQGVAHPDNQPASRAAAAQWVDSAGNLWIFGGCRTNTTLRRNDLWKYDPKANAWTWLNGDPNASSALPGVYGTKNTPSATNQPGSRGYRKSASWVDHKRGKLFLFSGYGFATTPTEGCLTDMWEYDMATNRWTWIGGGDSITTNHIANYGTLGVEAATNFPQPRGWPTIWQDSSGMCWMFGGETIIGAATVLLNDLWRFNPNTKMWTWMGGSNTLGTHNGVYGDRGVPSANNWPGARGMAPAVWVDVNNKLWMFGGYGLTESGTALVRMNDTWRYDPVTNQWTWMFGSKTVASTGAPGTYTTINSEGMPGGRTQAASWLDKDGNFWVYGGQGQTTTSANAVRGDYWKIEGVAQPIPAQPGPFTVAKPTVCSGESNVIYTISAVPYASSYEWQYTGSNTLFNTTTTSPSNNLSFAANASGGILRVRAVNGSGASAWRDTTITVNLSPTVIVTPSGTQNICAGGSIQLSTQSSLGQSYQWKNGTGNVGTNSSSFTATTAGSYTVTVTNTTTNCSTTSNPPVVVNVTNPPTISISPATVTICAGESATLTASGATSYNWSPTGGNAATATVSPVTTTTYTVTGTTAGCSGTATKTVTVNPVPVVTATNTGNQQICDGDSLLLTASSGGNVSYQWKNGTNNVGTGANYYAKTAGSYTVTVTNTSTNCSATSSPATALTVNPRPTATITAGGPTDICAGNTVSLNANQVSGVSYQWLQNGNSVGTNSGTYNAGATGAYSVKLTYTGTGCSNTSQPIDVKVHSRPSATLIADDTAFCEGEKTNLEVSTSDTGLSYRWLHNGTLLPQATTELLEVTGSGTYKVEVGRTAVAGCDSVTNELMITVHPLPVVNTNWDGAVLSATSGFSSYQWYSGGQAIPGATNDAYTPQSEGVFHVTVTDGNGCSNSSPAFIVKLGLDNLQFAQDKIRIYPNPTTGMVHIDAPQNTVVTVTGVDGKQLLNCKNCATIDMDNWSTGVYLIRISNDSGLVYGIEKLIKQ